MVKTACFQSMPSATSPDASSQEGMLCAIPTHRAVKLYVVQRRRASGTGSRSSLTKRASVRTTPGGSSTRPAGSGIGFSEGAGGTVAVMGVPFAVVRFSRRVPG